MRVPPASPVSHPRARRLTFPFPVPFQTRASRSSPASWASTTPRQWYVLSPAATREGSIARATCRRRRPPLHLCVCARRLTIRPQTGFEFKKRRAFPVLTGIVVAAENEAALLEVRLLVLPASPHFTPTETPSDPPQAYWEAERDAEAKRRAKRQEAVLKRWTKLVQGLRIRQRLLEQYADRTVPSSSTAAAAATSATADAVPPTEAADEVRR